MAIISGPNHWILTQDGVVSAVAFYDDTNGHPTRIDTFSSTQRAYKVELEGENPQTLNFLIPQGNNSRNVPNQVALGIDMRPDIEGVFENLNVYQMRLTV